MQDYGFYHPSRGYWQTIGMPSQSVLDGYPAGTLQVPLKPSDNHEWVDGAWTYLAADPDAELKSWREVASLSRSDFCIAIAKAGVVTAEEALAAAKGAWPPSFEPMLSQMTANERVEAEIIWAATSTVRRSDPLLSYVQASAQLEDAQVDAMFGWGTST